MNRNDELIALYLDDDLTEDQAVELKAWLSADAANLRKFVIATAREEQLRSTLVSIETLDAATERQTVEPELSAKNGHTRAILRWSLAASLLAAIVWFAVPRPESRALLTLTMTSGPVSLRDGDGRTIQLNSGVAFATGTLLVEGEGARAELSYTDGSTLSLAGGTELTLVSGNRKQLVLRRGAILARVSPQPTGQSMTVRTPMAEAMVLGTSFGMHAAEKETLLRVDGGTVKLRRLSDDQTTTVTVNEQLRTGPTDDRPWLAEPIAALPPGWRAAPDTNDSLTWLGQWSAGGTLRATPRTIFLKTTGTDETHFHAGAMNSLPGVVRLEADSAVRIRYRIKRPLNLGLFICTHATSWDFTGNFQAYVEERKTPPDSEGWRTTTVPLGSFTSMGSSPMPIRPGCIASTIYATIYATTFSDDVGLEVAELEVVSVTNGGQ